MLRKLYLIITFLITLNVDSQAPYILNFDELKNWTPSGNTADPALIATENLATRFINTNTQLNTSLSNNLQIAYLPDGMSNFANYDSEQSQFNLYNFTHWSYIDKIVWFGGTSSQPIQLPSAPWTNAAHKNGVKVLANVFFAPNVFGGSASSVSSFLEKNANTGEFLSIQPMVAMMQYYNFDGWFINQETDVSSALGTLMHEFLFKLTQAVEAVNKEVMWYDSMLLNGTISWQNYLNSRNSPFVQHDADGNASNGFEQRVSSGIFINFFWSGSGATGPNLSKGRANTIGRSPFNIFTGVDLWPGRNQAPFETGGNDWMSFIHQGRTNPTTSLGLFAPSCIFNNDLYSDFDNNPNDYANFYNAERHMFAGLDGNPFLEDNIGFKGYANWVPSASTIKTMPFETNFNTGHGLKKFENGIEINSSSWHNMNVQDILPTWQFAFSDNNWSGNWDFESAYTGGSSLNISGNLVANNDPVDLKLYKTNITLTETSKIDIIYNYESTASSELKLLLTFPGTPLSTFEKDISPNGETGWITRTIDLSEFDGESLKIVGMRFDSSQTIVNYNIKIGGLKIYEGPPLSTNDLSKLNNAITIINPNSRQYVNIVTSLSSTIKLDFDLYNLRGQIISRHTFNPSEGNYKLITSHLRAGVYFLKFISDKGEIVTKELIVR